MLMVPAEVYPAKRVPYVPDIPAPSTAVPELLMIAVPEAVGTPPFQLLPMFQLLEPVTFQVCSAARAGSPESARRKEASVIDKKIRKLENRVEKGKRGKGAEKLKIFLTVVAMLIILKFWNQNVS